MPETTATSMDARRDKVVAAARAYYIHGDEPTYDALFDAVDEMLEAEFDAQDANSRCHDA